MDTGVFSVPMRPNGLSSSRLQLTSSPTSWLLPSFVGGDENALVRAAVEPVIPTRFNPLVLFGPTGVGKSLLLKSIAARLPQPNTEQALAKPVVTNGADFHRAFAHAIAIKSTPDFRTSHRTASALLLDDLHQLTGKQEAQRELLATIDELLARGASLIFTSNSAPHGASWLLPSLASRLCGGLVVPLNHPGRQAKQVIVRELCDRYGLELTDELIDEFSQSGSLQTVPQINAALLELENVLQSKNVASEKQFAVAQVAKQILADRDATVAPSIRSITSRVAKYSQLTAAELKGPSRCRHIVLARSIAMFLAREMTSSSLEQVGRYFGNRDHTTVLHACRKTQSLLQTDAEVRRTVDELRNSLNAVCKTS